MKEWRNLGGDMAAKPGCDKPECYGQICVEPDACYGGKERKRNSRDSTPNLSIITRHDLAFYQGALDAAFEECEQLERTLNLPPGVHTRIYTRLKQWESLLDNLGECLPDA